MLKKKEREEKKEKGREKREKSKSISVNPLAVSMLSNARKAGEYQKRITPKAALSTPMLWKEYEYLKDLSNGIHAEYYQKGGGILG